MIICRRPREKKKKRKQTVVPDLGPPRRAIPDAWGGDVDQTAVRRNQPAENDLV